MLRSFAVILQRCDWGSVFVWADQRQVTDFEQRRSSKKHHIHRVMIDGVAQTALVDYQRAHPRAFRFNCGRQTSWSRANADDVVVSHKNFSVPGVLRNCNSTALALLRRRFFQNRRKLVSEVLKLLQTLRRGLDFRVLPDEDFAV